jgi:hypothetical protein
VAFAPETLTVNRAAVAGAPADSTYRGKRLVGYNRLDSERDSLSRAFNALENDKGLPGDVVDSLVVVNRTTGSPVASLETKVPLCTQSLQAVQRLGQEGGKGGVPHDERAGHRGAAAVRVRQRHGAPDGCGAAQRGAVLAQHAHAQSVERTDHHILGRLADQAFGAFAHFRSSLVGEGDGGNALRSHASLDQARDLVGDHPGLA